MVLRPITLLAPQLGKVANANPNAKAATPSSAVQPIATWQPPMISRSQSARGKFDFARGTAQLQSSRSAHNVFLRLPNENAMGTKQREEVMLDDEDGISSPDLMDDDIDFLDMQLSPSPPPANVPPLALNMGSKPSIIIDEEPVDFVTPRQFVSVEDAKKASDKELEAGFTMLASPTASDEDEYNELECL